MQQRSLPQSFYLEIFSLPEVKSREQHKHIFTLSQSVSRQLPQAGSDTCAPPCKIWAIAWYSCGPCVAAVAPVTHEERPVSERTGKHWPSCERLHEQQRGKMKELATPYSQTAKHLHSGSHLLKEPVHHSHHHSSEDY